MKRKILILITLVGCTTLSMAEPMQLTLDSCREMALRDNASSKVLDEAKLAAAYNRQAALAAMCPKVTANAAYTWHSKDAHLLANEMQTSYGTAGVGADGSAWFEWDESAPLNKQIQATKSNPELYKQLTTVQNNAGQIIAETYQQLYNALTVDLTHVVVAQVGVTQPIYVGGRLRELYKLSQASERMAGIRADSKRDDIILSVDEAYWRVVNVQQKKTLAENYYQLLTKLEQDVTELVAEGMATESDRLKVAVKRGEAESKLMQATNGLILSKMALCQVCGLPLDTDISTDDSGLEDEVLCDPTLDAKTAVAQRKELQLIEETKKIAESNVRIAAAGLQPNIVASANYVYTNPYAENGVSNNWKSKGFFSAGVVVNIPIAHAEDILRLKAAKHEANVVEYKLEEAREMLELQVTQANQKLMEANQKIALANLNLHNAEEVLRMANESFLNGMITSGDLMMAQTGWLSAASDKVDAEVEAKMCAAYLKKYTE